MGGSNVKLEFACRYGPGNPEIVCFLFLSVENLQSVRTWPFHLLLITSYFSLPYARDGTQGLLHTLPLSQPPTLPTFCKSSKTGFFDYLLVITFIFSFENK